MTSTTEDWVYDSVVGFLLSPLWTTPVMQFVEENSLVFDPEEENKLAYTDIHQNYGKLVESLLERHLDDLGISPEQFLQSCNLENAQSTYHEELFELVSAADDYELFRHIMLQKNVELELQALEVLQRQLGMVPESMRPATSTTEKNEMEETYRREARIERNKAEDDRLVQEAQNQSEIETQEEDTEFEENLARAMADSQADNERALGQSQLEQLQLEEALALSLKEMEQQNANQSTQPTTEARELPSLTAAIVAPPMSSPVTPLSARSQVSPPSQPTRPSDPPVSTSTSAAASTTIATASATITTASATASTTSAATAIASATRTVTEQPRLPEVDQRRMLHTLAGLQGLQPIPQHPSGSTASEWLKRAKADVRGGLMTSPEGIKIPPSEQDIKRRQEYLKSLRDKLQASKQGERSQQLESRQEPVRQAWQERPPASASTAVQDTTTKQDEELQRARALADTLKREVIEAEK